MVIVSESTEALDRARLAGVTALTTGHPHPAIREMRAINAAMLDLAQHLREVAGCTDHEGVFAELDAVIRELTATERHPFCKVKREA